MEQWQEGAAARSLHLLDESLGEGTQLLHSRERTEFSSQVLLTLLLRSTALGARSGREDRRRLCIVFNNRLLFLSSCNRMNSRGRLALRRRPALSGELLYGQCSDVRSKPRELD